MTWIERVEENCVEIFSPPLVRHWALFFQHDEDVINFRNETLNLVWRRIYFLFHLHSWVGGSFEKVLIQNQIANPALWNMGSSTKSASFYERLSLGSFSNIFLAELLASILFCLLHHHCCCKMRFPGKSKEHLAKEETAKNYLEQSYFFRIGNISASFWQDDDKHPLPTFFHRFSTMFKFCLLRVSNFRREQLRQNVLNLWTKWHLSTTCAWNTFRWKLVKEIVGAKITTTLINKTLFLNFVRVIQL